jgi:hypothetical protein
MMINVNQEGSKRRPGWNIAETQLPPIKRRVPTLFQPNLPYLNGFIIAVFTTGNLIS